jgi:hypothetical protein
MMKQLICAAVLAAGAVVMAGTANADPTPEPGPYQIQTPGGLVVGGLRTLPPVCAVQPRACSMTWDPNTGTWNAPPPSE